MNTPDVGWNRLIKAFQFVRQGRAERTLAHNWQAGVMRAIRKSASDQADANGPVALFERMMWRFSFASHLFVMAFLIFLIVDLFNVVFISNHGAVHQVARSMNDPVSAVIFEFSSLEP